MPDRAGRPFPIPKLLPSIASFEVQIGRMDGAGSAQRISAQYYIEPELERDGLAMHRSRLRPVDQRQVRSSGAVRCSVAGFATAQVTLKYLI